MAKQSSTQSFTEINLITEDVVVFTNGNGCLVLEVSPTNFALLSKQEQDARIFGYASFLNSLAFPVQILINNKRVDITEYLKLLDAQVAKGQNTLVVEYMKQYKNFVQELVKENVVLDKRFYISIPYSHLETGAIKALIQTTRVKLTEEDIKTIVSALHAKSEGIIAQLARIGLQTRILQKEELVVLFHEMYNEEISQSQRTSETTAAITTKN